MDKNNSLVPGLLLVLFIGLKLTGYIDWSWWWVLSPLWIPIALVGVFLIGALFVAGIGAILIRGNK